MQDRLARTAGNVIVRGHSFTLLLLLCAVPAGAEPLGRLFFTAEQRALLDRQRGEGSLADGASRTLRLDGAVARAGKPEAIWINHRLRHQAAAGAAARLRVGESVDPATQETNDVLAPGSLQVGRTQRH